MAGEDWPLVPLGELTENLDGRRVPVKENDRKPGPYPYYGASGIVDRVDGYLFDGDYLLIGEDGENLRTRQTPIAFMATGKFWVNNHAHIVRGNDRADTRFLSYVLSKTDISGYLTGSTMPKLTQGNLNRLPVIAPPLAEQKAIAAVLGALDDKIELNRRMNATLEAMARALFQSWFVDFDPVRAKLDGRPPAALDPTTAALFPDSFQDSELGPIPKGWNAKRLPEAIEVNPRRTLKAGTVAPYLDMKNLPTQGHSAQEVIDREFSSGTKFQNGDTLLARITPCLENGKTGFVDFLEDGQVGWGSTEYIVFAPKPPLPPQLGYLLARSDALRSHAIQNMTGTSGRQRVPSECFNTFWLAIPPSDIAERFDELTAPLMAKIKANADQSRTLATLRDTLLPKLLSGELSVADGSYSKFSNSSKTTETNP
jgi:type I restriction enzyme S subunit